jgi:hypothetical protein
VGAVLAVWSVIAGIAPHVLHHVGPLAGTGGTLLFAGIALVVSIPFLLRMYRRFHSWIAPASTLAVMTAMFLLSTFGFVNLNQDHARHTGPESSCHSHTFVLGPIIRGDTDTPAPQPDQIDQPVPPTGHNEHGH